ncbi:MAG TPA: HAMP domain-containing histidine kinase, partial [Bacteroidetes bacterium]|nr:HAMP domain-containing histidine kinase [Bacteroidota bacterium]
MREGDRANPLSPEPPPADPPSPEPGPPEDRREAEVMYALEHRPRVSIRARLLFGFLLLILLSFGEDVVNLVTLKNISRSFDFLLIAERFTHEIQQARRFEKNFFLYSTGLDEAIHHAKVADSLLSARSVALRDVIGHERFAQLRDHGSRYLALLEEIAAREGPPPQAGGETATTLREHGSKMLSLTLDFARNEQDSVRRMLNRSVWLPLIFIALLLLVAMYMTFFLGRQIIRRLSELMVYTERIARGDFTPIPPARRYKDEISNMTIALNRMMHDLRKHEEVMVQSHKLRAVGTLTAGIAHELNNPLNNITLTASVLNDGYEDLSDDERREMIHELLQEADRAETIVRNLLDFARESEMESTLLDLHDLLQETLKLLRNELRLRKLHVSLDAPEGPVRIHGDRQQLSQVFVNLLMNSIDVLEPHGHIDITLLKEADPGFVAVEVRDDGPGIPAHILPNIFDPFFTTKPTGKGTGLGLSVSLGIVKRHGGNITVESREGR